LGKEGKLDTPPMTWGFEKQQTKGKDESKDQFWGLERWQSRGEKGEDFTG